MRNLSLYWIAKFKDNSELHQFDDKGNETKFEEVKKRFNELTQFTLYHRERQFYIAIDLKLGHVFFSNNNNNTIFLQPEPDMITPKKNIRLIYFRRNKHYLNGKLEVIGKKLFYMIGYQYNDEQRNSHKIIFQLDSDGNMVLV